MIVLLETAQITLTLFEKCMNAFKTVVSILTTDDLAPTRCQAISYTITDLLSFNTLTKIASPVFPNEFLFSLLNKGYTIENYLLIVR